MLTDLNRADCLSFVPAWESIGLHEVPWDTVRDALGIPNMLRNYNFWYDRCKFTLDILSLYG